MADGDFERLRPRAVPRQRRSTERRQAILEATERLLERMSPHALTTSHIAFEAGVPVSSVYAYFPNKQAVIAELMRAALAEVDDRVEALLPDVPTLSAIEAAVDAQVDEVLAGYRDVAARRHIFRALRRDDLLASVMEASDARSVAAVATRVAALRPDIGPVRARAVGETVVRAFAALQDNVILCEDPALLPELVTEWRRLIKAYLRPLAE